jgi:hypothetical protein
MIEIDALRLPRPDDFQCGGLTEAGSGLYSILD